jgi:TMEM175 potassium channel family protein
MACRTVTGAMLWAKLHLLFWLSLLAFATGRMGENHFTAMPTALYGVVLLMAAIAYYLLQQAIIRAQGPDAVLKKWLGATGRASFRRCCVSWRSTTPWR